MHILGCDASWNELWPVFFVKSNFIKACLKNFLLENLKNRRTDGHIKSQNDFFFTTTNTLPH